MKAKKDGDPCMNQDNNPKLEQLINPVMFPSSQMPMTSHFGTDMNLLLDHHDLGC